MMENWTRKQVAERLRQFICDQLNSSHSADLNPGDIQEADEFISALGADSLDMIEVAMTCEKYFGIEIPDQSLREIITVKDAIHLLWKRLN